MVGNGVVQIRDRKLQKFRISAVVQTESMTIGASKKYGIISHSDFFCTNWKTNLISSLNSREKLSRGRLIIRSLRKDLGMLILNAGSNIGFHTVLAVREGFETISLDPSRSALSSGKKLNWIGECICGDVMHLPFRDCVFSNAIFSEVIEEIPDQSGAIIELARCCDRIVITTSPIRSDVFYRTSKRVKSLLREYPSDIAHIQEIDPNELVNMIGRANLAWVSISYHNPFHIWNIASVIPYFPNLDLSVLDSIFGFKAVSAGLLCVAERVH